MSLHCSFGNGLGLLAPDLPLTSLADSHFSTLDLTRRLWLQERMHDTILTLFHCYQDEEDDENRLDKRQFTRRLEAIGIRYKSVHLGCDGTCCLNLSGTIITDLSLLKELPVTHLCLQGCYGITDFSPLRDMTLTWLNLSRTRMKDLSSLRGLPLAHLKLYWTWTTSLNPLREAPLKSLDIRFTAIKDVSPLRHMPLQELSFFPSRISRGLHSLRGIGTLTRINRRPAGNFWKRYDE